MLLLFSSCVQEESETTILYYNTLDANGQQVNVSVDMPAESSSAKQP